MSLKAAQNCVRLRAVKEEKNFDITGDYIAGMVPGQLFFSNSVENLFEKLKTNLFSNNTAPFSKRLVIVPSAAMEKWIRMRLAEDLQIAAGFTTSFLENALQSLFEMDHFLTELELLLMIERELDFMNEEWPELRRYLQGREKRRLPLAKQLASLFIRYGIYGNRLCGMWELGPKNWQEALWKRIAEKATYPLRLLPKLQMKEFAGSIHLFSFSHIPPLYFHFFQQLPSVYFYQLSPSLEFWSDLSIEHPLLTHFGRVGREMAKCIEESELSVDEHYRIPEGKTQLERLQRELLYLEKEETLSDDSIQLHSSTSLYREVENLKGTIVDLLQEGFLEPKDILVMAPDIALYEPYLQTFFKDIPFQIADMPLRKSHPQVESLFLLLDLEKRRWSAPALLALFGLPLFQKKIGWNEEELLQIQSWVESTGIRWGLSKKSRDALLKKRYCLQGVDEKRGTWEGGIDLLIEELAIPRVPPRIDFSQAALLGEWKEVILRLEKDFFSFQRERTLREWVDLLIHLHQDYFCESDFVILYLEKLALASRHDPSRVYTFVAMRLLLEETFNEKSQTINGNQIQAIRFCSLLPMRAIPAKVIFLIGMNHDAFPRKDRLLSLDMIKEKGDYAPSRLDFDRYLFLEALLSAREKLIISYVRCDPHDQTPWPPSSVIAEIMPYISQFQHHAVYLPLKKREARPFLFCYHPKKIEIPPCEIDLTDLVRPFRSPLRHYLFHRNFYIQEERIIQEEEPLQLSALRRSVLCKANDATLHRAIREGDFPLGLFANVATKQLELERNLIPREGRSERIDLKVGPVCLVGMLEGILTDSLMVYEKCSMRGAVRSWPLFLVYIATHPEGDGLLFAREGKKVNRFFDDPNPHLERVLRYYFLSSQIPTPLFPDWIEPILKQDPIKLAKATNYDLTLAWALRGQSPLPPEKVIELWKEEAEILYKELKNAWF